MQNIEKQLGAHMRQRRENHKRVFVNRDLMLGKVKYFGYDMDYTLAEYFSPCYEELTLKHAVKVLVKKGYPKAIEEIKYDERFSIRGVFFDKKYGNFLKVDRYGNILKAVRGLKPLATELSRELYKNRFIEVKDSEQYWNFYTVFDLPSMFLISYLVEHFTQSPEWTETTLRTGFECGSLKLFFSKIFEDVLEAFKIIHCTPGMKQETIDSIDKYIRKDDRLPVFLRRVQDAGKKNLLITNSDYWYTNRVLTYLFSDAKNISHSLSEDWRSYFDLVIVDARKPKFFADGTPWIKIDPHSEGKVFGTYVGAFAKGDVFSGGNSERMCEYLNCQGKEILFVGDHIFGDILKSKMKKGWRTFLVIPELKQEMRLWLQKIEQYTELEKLEVDLYNLYNHFDLSSTTAPKSSSQYLETIKTLSHEIENTHGPLGSLFRWGRRPTYFASQITLFADLYSHTCLNLLYYPFFYYFRVPLSLMPHEAILNQLTEEQTKDASTQT